MHNDQATTLEKIRIFDQPELVGMVQKYSKVADHNVPEIVLLARSDKLANERKEMEELFQLVAGNVQRDWLRRLLQESHQQYMGAWFEIKLFGLLRKAGNVVVGAELVGNKPDFVLEEGKTKIAIEARALLYKDEELRERRRSDDIFQALKKIVKPYIILVDDLKAGCSFSESSFINIIIDWLDASPDQPFIYSDENGNSCKLKAKRQPHMKHVNVIYSSKATWVNIDLLKPALKEKAKQHQAIRQAGYPYVIAILLEPWMFSAEDVINAWIGKETYTYDFDSKEFIDSRLDRSGLHYHRGNTIYHQSVSGTLVFKKEWRADLRKQSLVGCYIQNPFAKNPIVPDIFPVDSRYVVTEKTKKEIKMAWQPNNPDEQ